MHKISLSSSVNSGILEVSQVIVSYVNDSVAVPQNCDLIVNTGCCFVESVNLSTMSLRVNPKKVRKFNK